MPAIQHEIRLLGGQSRFSYDPQGRLESITDAKQQNTGYGYDEQSRLETIDYDDGRSVTLSYDPLTGSGQAGNLAGYDDGTTSVTYSYDSLGCKPSETVNYGTFSPKLSG